MLRVFWDASALLKRYTPEIGTALVNEVFLQVARSEMCCSRLAIPEIVATLGRKRNDRRLSQESFEQALVEFRKEIVPDTDLTKVSVHDTLVDSSLELIVRHNLNATDAILLSTVLSRATPELVLFTSDKRLVRAAQAEGVTVSIRKRSRSPVCGSSSAAARFDLE